MADIKLGPAHNSGGAHGTNSPTAHLELTAGIIRVCAPGLNYEAGDPYEWCAEMVNLGRGALELRGVTIAPTAQQARAIQACLLAAGYTKLRVERWVGGKRWVREHLRNRSERSI